MKVLARLLLLAVMTLSASPAFAQTLPSAFVCNTCSTSLAVTNATGRVALPSTSPPYNTLTVYNSGTKDAYFVQGDVTVVATTSGIKIPAGTRIAIAVNGTYVAAITGGSDTTTLLMWQSNGLVDFGGGPGGGGTVSGTVTANQGTAAAVGSAWPILLTDGTNTGSVKAASTNPATTDKAIVTTPVPNGSTCSANITNTASACAASAALLKGWFFGNQNASVCYVQFFDLATGSVTLGTTTPKLSLPLPALGGANLSMPSGMVFSTAITWAATTTRSGSTACTSGVDANAWFN